MGWEACDTALKLDITHENLKILKFGRALRTASVNSYRIKNTTVLLRRSHMVEWWSYVVSAFTVPSKILPTLSGQEHLDYSIHFREFNHEPPKVLHLIEYNNNVSASIYIQPINF